VIDVEQDTKQQTSNTFLLLCVGLGILVTFLTYTPGLGFDYLPTGICVCIGITGRSALPRYQTALSIGLLVLTVGYMLYRWGVFA